MLLTDDQIMPLVDRENPVVEGIRHPTDWFGADSPVQPASLDLTIGKILLPGTKKEDPGGELNPLTEHILKPGRTAVVTTFEQFRMPADMVGVGFPPSRVSFQGILMTNPGQVDPGYEGRMRFTVINMGSQDYVLRRRDAIVTLLLFKLSDRVHVDWLQRRKGKPGGDPAQKDLDRLAADFLDVDRRATEISNAAVVRADLQVKRFQLWVPVFSGLATVIVAGLFAFFSTRAEPAWREPLTQVQRDVAVLKTSLDVGDVKNRLDELERTVKAGKLTSGSNAAIEMPPAQQTRKRPMRSPK